MVLATWAKEACKNMALQMQVDKLNQENKKAEKGVTLQQVLPLTAGLVRSFSSGGNFLTTICCMSPPFILHVAGLFYSQGPRSSLAAEVPEPLEAASGI